MCSKDDGSARDKREVAFSLIPEKKKKKRRFKKKKKKRKKKEKKNRTYGKSERLSLRWTTRIILACCYYFFFFPAFSFPLGFLVVAFVSFVSYEVACHNADEKILGLCVIERR